MSDFTERIWAMAGGKARARANAVRAPITKVVEAVAKAGLDGVAFASDRAHELAIDHKLSWVDFEDLEPSSERGYTASDVRHLTRGG